MAFGEKQIGKMRTDEAGYAGDEVAHVCSFGTNENDEKTVCREPGRVSTAG
jgi:hypothetical protein